MGKGRIASVGSRDRGSSGSRYIFVGQLGCWGLLVIEGCGPRSSGSDRLWRSGACGST